MLATTSGALWFGGAIDFGHHLPPSAWQKPWTPFHHSPRFNRIFKVTFHDMSCFISMFHFEIPMDFSTSSTVSSTSLKSPLIAGQPAKASPNWTLGQIRLHRHPPEQPSSDDSAELTGEASLGYMLFLEKVIWASKCWGFTKRSPANFASQNGYVTHQIYQIPVVPHKAVAEISKIGNL